jgi:hypothetical protein
MGGSPSAKHITADVTGTDNGKQLELRIVGMHTDGITCGFATGWIVVPGMSPSCAVIPITAPGTAQGLWHGDGKLPPFHPTTFVTTDYQFALTCSGCKGLPGATLGGHSEGPLSGISFASEISIAAAANHLDPTLLAAIAAQETGGPSSDSGQNIKGDCTPNCHGYGVFQIDDRSHSDFTSTPQAMNPAVNAEYAATMMQDLLAKYGGDIHKALSSYNAGGKGNRCGTKTFWKANGDTLCYADSVLRHQGRIKNRKVGSCQ